MEENPVKPEQAGEQPSQQGQVSQPSPPSAPASVNDQNSPVHPSNTHKDKNKKKREPLSCAEIWTIVLWIISIVVAAATGAAIVYQGTIASATLKELHMSARSDVAANRAWIVPDPPPQNKSSLAEANLEWHNAGKTPAVAVFSSPEYFVGEFPHRLKTCAEMERELKRRPVSEWQYQAFVPAGGRYETGLSNTPPWVGQAPISIHGCIWYTDVLSNTQRTTEFFLTAFQMKFAFPHRTPNGISLFYLADRPFVFQ